MARALERWSWACSLLLLLLIGQHYWKLKQPHSAGIISYTTTIAEARSAISTRITNKPTNNKNHSSLFNGSTDIRATKEISTKKTTIITQTKVPEKNTIYVITATYRRPQQLAELTRLAQTLMHVRNLFWLVIEDAHNKTRHVEELLERSGIEHVYMLGPMPEEFDREKYEFSKLPRGVSNRNKGLDWLRTHASDGVFYFADDDNTYDIRLFEEMRDTRTISVWPVGLLSGGFGSPVVRNGRFSGFYAGWSGSRTWKLDMAGFAVSVELLHKRPRAKMPYAAGYEEDGFFKSLYPIRRNEIQIRAKNCTQKSCHLMDMLSTYVGRIFSTDI